MEDYKISMGKRMRERRKALHLTQEQMAEKLNISIKHYGGVERGIAGLSIENLIEVSNILGMNLDYLIKGECQQDNIMPGRMKELYFSCPQDKRQHLIELLETASKFWISASAGGSASDENSGRH